MDNVTLAPWQQRVVQEQAELSEKVEKLEAFLGSDQVEQLPTDQQDWLDLQCRAMALYLDVLNKRIAGFGA